MQEFKLKIGEHDLILEIGKMARLANGAVFAKYAGTSVLSTVCCSSETKEDLDFVPLSVDYNERYYAAGKIPGGFLKREARPKDKEILVSRLIDRPMRPLFHKAFGREIQLVPMTVSTDQIHTPDTVAMIAAFASVMVSDIPFKGPVAAVRVASVNDKFVVNPTFQQIEASELDIIVAGADDGICMVEGGAQQVSEERMLEAIEIAEKEIIRICAFLVEVQKAVGKEKLTLPEAKKDFHLADSIRENAQKSLETALFAPDKASRGLAIKKVKIQLLEDFADKLEDDDMKAFESCFDDLCRDIVRGTIISEKRRCDGRSPSEIRPITCELDILARAHGSSLFTRGETQSLGVVFLLF